jgi:hypothetical protein
MWSSIGEWAEAYIRVHEAEASLDETHPDYLAAYEFMVELVGDSAEQAWAGVLEVVKRRPSERVLGMIAAGLMEDLLHYSGETFISRIESQASADAVFRRMLHGVWESGEPDVWSRLVAARGRSEDAA